MGVGGPSLTFCHSSHLPTLAHTQVLSPVQLL